jgi:hypothetical protein
VARPSDIFWGVEIDPAVRNCLRRLREQARTDRVHLCHRCKQRFAEDDIVRIRHLGGTTTKRCRECLSDYTGDGRIIGDWTG